LAILPSGIHGILLFYAALILLFKYLVLVVKKNFIVENIFDGLEGANMSLSSMDEEEENVTSADEYVCSVSIALSPLAPCDNENQDEDLNDEKELSTVWI